ncbi:uncharacterized protein PHACADRAFT_265728 [Phanerochaete carnosa HHB-10118-sp]|uniref:Uncharacterized protein n=1 Tax=Phanerochaete carnosa (strain HHB-10118-sp) TaxID=650164 RepID=K5VRM5_PHACS|nr:uncharacterized protein PHACADRAFT_265728 [Phanerochaete carnosa HHB-10118-sp]EKM49234.1 hypothetical protein PHACADRAFT_265728 [Phanerochaete carnosa HHB-10118-sp]
MLFNAESQDAPRVCNPLCTSARMTSEATKTAFSMSMMAVGGSAEAVRQRRDRNGAIFTSHSRRARQTPENVRYENEVRARGEKTSCDIVYGANALLRQNEASRSCAPQTSSAAGVGVM